MLLQPHLSQHAPNPQRTKDDAETVAKILERDRKKHDNLPIPIKVVRDLMERGLVQDPQFERDCEGLAAVQRQERERERTENRRLYRPAWVADPQLWSSDMKDAIERGVFVQ